MHCVQKWHLIHLILHSARKADEYNLAIDIEASRSGVVIDGDIQKGPIDDYILSSGVSICYNLEILLIPILSDCIFFPLSFNFHDFQRLVSADRTKDEFYFEVKFFFQDIFEFKICKYS